MNDALQSRMAEATRLTLQGQLAEATALIQAGLAAAAHPKADVRHPDDTKESIEGTARVVDDAPPAVATIALRSPLPGRHAREAATPSPGISAQTRSPAPDRPTGNPSTSGVAETLRRQPRTIGPTAPVGNRAGRFIEGSYTGPAGSRAYRLYVPSGYTGRAAPLLVMLHGCTQSAEDFAAGTQMNTLAETHTFLVAYPAQPATANSSRCWNWFETAHQSRRQGEPAIIAGITQQVMATYNIDARRVYVAGLSAGGAMAAVLGVAYPDLYAAVGIHSGLAYGAAANIASAMNAMQRGGSGPTMPAAHTSAAPGVLPRVVPLILFHGERDTTVSPRNADQLVAQWVAAYGGATPDSTEQLVGGQKSTRTVYRDADKQPFVEHWRVQGLGHAWFGGDPGGSYTDARGPSASAEMVRFFMEHPRG